MNVTLAIDCGNSCVKWGFYGADAQRIGAMYRAQLNEFDWPRVDGTLGKDVTVSRILLSSVSDAKVSARVASVLEDNTGIAVAVAKTESRWNELINAYRQHEQLGVDRWLAMKYCWHTTKNAFLVVDCGTAVTLDLVSSKGQHLGGYILPSVRKATDILKDNTGNIEKYLAVRFDSETPLDILGQSTEGCITLGMRMAILTLCEKLRELLPADAPTLFTGGDGKVYSDQVRFKSKSQYVDDLVLRGLII